MYFWRRAYDQLMVWKEKYADRYAALLEGARRVGKSTIAEHFAQNEYESYILIDFANPNRDVLDCFDDMGNLDIFFLRLQAACGITLVRGKSCIIFDEIQRFPRARQAIKYLVRDGRYQYIETGSLISIKKNVKDILIPSEEMKLNVFPMDYEEFCLAVNSSSYELGKQFFIAGKSVGQAVNRKLMRDYRIYMAVGGMPQAVKAYTEGRDFAEIDRIKREIISLYEEDFYKIDPSGYVSNLYHAVPAELARDVRRYRLNSALGKRRGQKANEILYDLIDSKTVLISYNSTDPLVSLAAAKDLDSFKMYLADTGLFVTLMFIDRPVTDNDLYIKLLSDKLPANLGYLYENAVAQAITATGRELFYHTWNKENSTHYYEIDFLVADGRKLSVIEVKSSGTGKHESLSAFRKRYGRCLETCYVLSQKDVHTEDGIQFLPVYMISYILKSA